MKNESASAGTKEASGPEALQERGIFMSRKIALFAACVVTMAAFSMTAAASDSPAAETDLAGSDYVMGGWELNLGSTLMADSPEALAAFENATEGLADFTFEPVALLGTQIVSGTNYAVLCRETTLPAYEVVYIYEDLQGNAQVLGTEAIQIGDYDLLPEAVYSDAPSDTASDSSSDASSADAVSSQADDPAYHAEAAQAIFGPVVSYDSGAAGASLQACIAVNDMLNAWNAYSISQEDLIKGAASYYGSMSAEDQGAFASNLKLLEAAYPDFYTDAGAGILEESGVGQMAADQSTAEQIFAAGEAALGKYLQ